MPLDDITTKAGPLIDTQNPIYPSNNAANDTSDDGADRTGCSLAFARTAFDSSGHALSRRRNGYNHGSGDDSRSESMTDHILHPV